MERLRDRVVDGDQLRAVREGCFDLHQVHQFGNAVHDFVAGDDLGHPSSITSGADLPSLAASRMASVISVTDSGTVSFRPRPCRLRARSAAT